MLLNKSGMRGAVAQQQRSASARRPALSRRAVRVSVCGERVREWMGVGVCIGPLSLCVCTADVCVCVHACVYVQRVGAHTRTHAR